MDIGDTDDDNDVCVVCGKFQPDAFTLNANLKFVDWGCCVVCNKWVNLKLCSDVDKLADDSGFECPNCKTEQ
ncbi:hypothetical protein DPMN_154349 [Dreissena polymorpha]|uniref:Uncharacterized protein n=1 Tax=Dreissena polymorpha TaxID=45954 RepID=A0A9D4FK94_DREPO|nr:hypothetical protein DPMN_154349 [Dreissena polymorpha]